MSVIDRTPTLFDLGPKRLPVDVCSRKHRGAITSVEANSRVNKSGDRAKVLAVILELGNATLKEICAQLGREKNTLSGRISELLATEYIWFNKHERRDGCRVYRVK